MDNDTPPVPAAPTPARLPAPAALAADTPMTAGPDDEPRLLPNRLPKGVRANWELGAQLIAGGNTVGQVAFNLGVEIEKVRRNLRESRAFRQMIEKERLARRETSALRLGTMHAEVVSQLIQAIHDGDRRILLWAAKVLNVTAGWPDRDIAAAAEKDRAQGRAPPDDLVDDERPA